MNRAITGYHLDAENDWVAELDCGHGQHVRHKPPFFNRPWVMSEAGRDAKLGFRLNCVRCDRLELPEAVVCYRTTPRYTDATLPAGLRRAHHTKTGTWGRIIVHRGAIGYRIDPPLERFFELGPATPGIIPPGVMHALEPSGPVALQIEFYR